MTNPIQLKRSVSAGVKPSALLAGELAVNTADGVVYLELADGSVVAVGQVRTGEIVNAVIQPPGTLLCDLTAVSRSVYARLFALIGTTYGAGNGSTTFNLPDRRHVMWRTFVAGTETGMALTANVINSNFYIYT